MPPKLADHHLAAGDPVPAACGGECAFLSQIM